jgi:hypothetical protein
MVFENRDAKASQGGMTENERKYSILGSIRKFMDNPGYLQVLQLVLLQEEQPDETAVPASGLSVPAEQKTENFFFTSFDLHLGQFTS